MKKLHPDELLPWREGDIYVTETGIPVVVEEQIAACDGCYYHKHEELGCPECDDYIFKRASALIKKKENGSS